MSVDEEINNKSLEIDAIEEELMKLLGDENDELSMDEIDRIDDIFEHRIIRLEEIIGEMDVILDEKLDELNKIETIEE